MRRRSLSAVTALTAICLVSFAAAPSLAGVPAPSLPTQAVAVQESVPVNGISMAYRDIGEGEPLVLLHGFMGTGAMWDAILDELASRYRVIVPDLRGHGGSTNPERTFTHRQAAEDVFALLDLLEIDRFKAMGGSTGAMTLLHMATAQPTRVEAMVLLAGTSYFPEQARRHMRAMRPEAASVEDLERQARAQGHVRGAEQLRDLMTQFRDFQHSYDDMNFTPPYLSTIEAATLIVYGDRDEFFPVSIAMEMYEAIPTSYLWVVPNTDHAVLLWSDRGRARLVETALDFLSGEWAADE